ncbi:hypothetical protein [Mesorhizobium sp. M0217]|uniref:hypothetical protein n=1 Tax=unclassified Mesorhizobium TaxID=325217 RepID=UPI00333D6F09
MQKIPKKNTLTKIFNQPHDEISILAIALVPFSPHCQVRQVADVRRSWTTQTLDEVLVAVIVAAPVEPSNGGL